MEAVDANIVRDRWLMVVLPDEVRKFDIQFIRDESPEYMRNGEIREFQPRALDLQSKKHEKKHAMSRTGEQLVAVACGPADLPWHSSQKPWKNRGIQKAIPDISML
jgi:hypothetical protein